MITWRTSSVRRSISCDERKKFRRSSKPMLNFRAIFHLLHSKRLVYYREYFFEIIKNNSSSRARHHFVWITSRVSSISTPSFTFLSRRELVSRIWRIPSLQLSNSFPLIYTIRFPFVQVKKIERKWRSVCSFVGNHPLTRNIKLDFAFDIFLFSLNFPLKFQEFCGFFFLPQRY